MKILLLSLFIGISTMASAYEWEQLADFAGVARHRTPMLAIGNKIYTGLGHYNGGGVNILWEDWWEYDPATNAWTQKADYMGGINYHAAGFVIGDYGYVGTGRVTASGNNLTTTFYRYDPVTNSWEQKANFGGAPRRGAVGFAIDGYGYIGTGEPQSGSLYNDFYRYDPVADNWSPIASLPTPGRVSAVGFELGGYGYVGTGGFGSWSNSQKDFWRYDPGSNSWQQMANVEDPSSPLPGSTNTRMEASGFSQLGKGYILCGDNASSGTNYSDMYEYDPALDQWTRIEDFPGTSRRYMACVTLNDITYCGLGTSGTNFRDFWRFSAIAGANELVNVVEVTAYPNPVINTVSFNTSFDEEFEIVLSNSFGQIVSHTIGSNGNALVERNKIPSGVYQYSIIVDQVSIKTGSLIFK